MKIQLGVEAPSDVERVANAFGTKFGLDRPATAQEIAADLGRYIKDTVRGQEQTKAVQAVDQLPPVDVESELEPTP